MRLMQIINIRSGLICLLLMVFIHPPFAFGIDYEVKGNWESDKVMMCEALYDSISDPPDYDPSKNPKVEVIVRDAPSDSGKEITRINHAINYGEVPILNGIEVYRDGYVAYLPLEETKGDWGKIVTAPHVVELRNAWIKQDGKKARLISKRSLFEDFYLLRKNAWVGIDLSQTGYRTYKSPDESEPSIVHDPKAFEDKSFFVARKPLVQILELQKQKDSTFVKIGFHNKKILHEGEGLPNVKYEKNDALKKLDETWIKLTNENHAKVVDLNHWISIREKISEIEYKERILDMIKHYEKRLHEPGAKEALERNRKELDELNKTAEEKEKDRIREVEENQIRVRLLEQKLHQHQIEKAKPGGQLLVNPDLGN